MQPKRSPPLALIFMATAAMASGCDQVSQRLTAPGPKAPAAVQPATIQPVPNGPTIESDRSATDSTPVGSSNASLGTERLRSSGQPSAQDAEVISSRPRQDEREK
ncbi:MAG: hypothetical protein O2848_04345 [Proteobacteria bacterium]|nr:hypothetical protein [Pseudomonadota bacterium]